MPSLSRGLVAALPLTLLLASCGSAGTDGEGTGAGAAGDGAQVEVVASFYPLEYLVTRVAGDHAEVTSLTRPGVDPHDVELTPREVGSLGSADLVVFSSGMQPAVDQAVETQAADHAFDVDGAANLLALGESDEDHDAHAAEGAHADDEGHTNADDHADDEHADDDGHDHGGEDPHFWLDPERYADVAEAVAERLAGVAPEHAADFEANAAALVADLEELDAELATGLAECETRELVTTHEAFGYLAQRYDLHQTGITGISPESEPSAARLAEITTQVRDEGITTIYAEPLLSSSIAETVAQETGARVLTLDPADGLTDASAGDYLDIMRANLQALRDGLGCS